MGPGFLLMHDMWLKCQQFMHDEGIDGTDWPARSPDLNPFEHIWDIMSRSIHQRHVGPQPVQELTDALIHVWEEIPQESSHCLIRRTPRRCREVVIQARGGHTHYWASFWLILRNFHWNWISLLCDFYFFFPLLFWTGFQIQTSMG